METAFVDAAPKPRGPRHKSFSLHISSRRRHARRGEGLVVGRSACRAAGRTDPDNSLFLISLAMVTRRSGRELLADRYAGFSSLHVGPND